MIKLLQQWSLLLFASLFTMVCIAQSGETYKTWANETFADIERDLGINGSALFREKQSANAVAFNWPQGIQFHAVTAAQRTSQAQSMANEIHNRYWCFKNNIWGYSASADGCGGRFYDDNAWIAKGLMELYELTDNITYVDRAKQVVAFSMSGENPSNGTPNGGIRWQEGNTTGQCLCATAPTTAANLLIYQATGEQKYLTDGLRLYNWIKANKFGVGPGYRGYENAVVTQAALTLHEITGDDTYYEDAKRMGLRMETAYIDNYTGALRESGKWGGHDMAAAYVDLWEVDGDINWLNIAAGFVNFTYNELQGNQGRYPVQWDGSDNEVSQQLLDFASVARGFAELSVTPGGDKKAPDAAAIYRNCQYENWFSTGLAPGQYTQADLEYLGFGNNRVSALRVSPDFQITLYDGDNFTGDSQVFNADDACLDDNNFNNRATSIIVEPRVPVATVYEHCNFDGRGVTLTEGLYNLFDLQKRGMKSNNISSVKVPAGYELVGYDGADFGDTGTVLSTDDNCLVDNGANDLFSSVELRKVGTSTPHNHTNVRIENRGHSTWLQGTHFGDGSGVGNNAQAVDQRFTGGKTRWTLRPVQGNQGYYRIENTFYQQWLQMSDVSDATNGQPNAVADGDTKAVRLVDTTNTGDWTQWRKVMTDNGYFHLENKHFGYYLQVTSLIDVDGNGFDGGFQIRGVKANKTGSWTQFKLVSDDESNNNPPPPTTPDFSATIQAEHFTNMFGVETETTTDVDGGLNVGWIDTADWMAYANLLNLPQAGTYRISYRIASLGGGQLSADLDAGAVQLGTVEIPATGGWQNWQTVSHEATLPAGPLMFGLYAAQGGFNLNWFQVELLP
ncbi:carbohydrate-binding protein [Reinekea blandensis]|uniref:Probable glycosyl hydrolase n=1 Tax=Reinekea blandensis MED297 TaxID=314283 RepID=A4BGK1_9GAMM|nr:carbohydrate-binding protein [Reinekea blandensis]EAR08807.1 probable glycosyl hydrolase [Reinekea sp. MED297] [Reinekea blandensis MED297]